MGEREGAPPAPALKPAVIDPKTTALLVLDFVQQTCNAERRPRCVASVPKVRGLLDEARNRGVPIVHSVVTGQSASRSSPTSRRVTASVSSPRDRISSSAPISRILADK